MKIFCLILWATLVWIQVPNVAWGFAPKRITLESFGYQRLKPQYAPSKSTPSVDVPMVVVRVDFRDKKFQSHHDAAYFEDLFQGTRQGMPSGNAHIRDYFRQVSRGRMTVHLAGNVGPVTFPDDPATMDDESVSNCFSLSRDANNRLICPNSSRTEFKERATEIKLAQLAGFPVQNFDTNRNGIIDNWELRVVTIWAGGASEVGGAVRWPSPSPAPLTNSSVRFGGQVGVFSEYAPLTTIAHELSHLFGTEDVYGVWAGANYGATLMGAISESAESRRGIHLDPWHKMQFGWTEPRLVPIDSTSSSCHRISLAHQIGSADQPPLLIYDPKVGTDRYFLLEYRRPDLADASDQGARSSGVAIWYVQTQSGGRLKPIPTMILPGTGQPLRSRPPARSDDLLSAPGSGQYITRGPDNILQTRPTSGSGESVQSDNGLLLVSYTPSQAGETLGLSNFFPTGNPTTPTLLRWPLGGATQKQIRVGVTPDGIGDVSIAIEPQHSPLPVLNRLSSEQQQCYQNLIGR